MKEAERRLFRCIGGIADEQVLEASTARFRPKRRGHWLALAACLGLCIALPLVLRPPAAGPEVGLAAVTQESAAKTEAAEGSAQTDDAAGFVFSTAGILQTETLGGLRPGMTEQEVVLAMGQPDNTGNVSMVSPDGAEHFSWFYKTGSDPERMHDTRLSLADIGEGWFLNEISVLADSPLTLSTGIGIGSTKAEVEAAYPHAERSQGESIVNDQPLHHDFFTLEDGLRLTLTDGICSSITLGPWLQLPPEEAWDTDPEPLPYDLTSGEVEIYLSTSEGGLQVTATDKAAKRICTVLTITVPEQGQMPEGMLLDWLDLGNGTVVGMMDDDYAVVYTCGGAFDPDSQSNLTPHLWGQFPGLYDAVRQALADPNETWESAP